MRLTAMMMAMMMTAEVSQARGAEPEAARRLTICMDGAAGSDLTVARLIVSQMFAGIGVAIDWHTQMAGCPAGALKISLSHMTEKTLRPSALAYALPYEGTHIVVFYDRIQRMGSLRSAPHIMAHVIAHEITHVVGRVDRHSLSGVMKARWSDEELRAMERKPLAFTAEDVDLIYMGLTYRAEHAADTVTVAANPTRQ
jgi:hypothetical protein